MDLLKKGILGRTGITVSEFCFGTLTMSRLQADISPAAAEPAFRRAMELGVNFFDTANRYATYEHVRVGLGKAIADMVIASKTDAKVLDEAKEQVDRCFRSLGRDMIDVFLLHCVDGEEDYRQRRPVLDYLQELKAKGKIRAVGLSAHRLSGNQAAIDHADELDVLFPVINYRGLGIVDGSLADGLASIERARRAGLGIYAMKPLGGGHLRADAPAAINFLRANPNIDSIAVGIKSVAEVEVNAAIFSDGKLPLDPEKARGIVAADRRTIVNFMCKRCGACLEHCDQKALSLGEVKAQIDESKCILCGYCAPHCPEFAIRVI